eukprot:TRINITY_DN2559_c0_g1_i1.p2 TRINITY_DN2559_c0_g1~~TRINITY_DN2559_c0_g1_i1.p2  ORF type:complete len:666 (+),score=298.20 TRINITY_DN2559_c0_g1_i1:96-2000(+)
MAVSLLLLAGAAASVPRGVPPDAAARYAGDFRCGDGGAGKVNDDYCDCADGSDEPGTSACAGVGAGAKFWCANEGHKAESIVTSRVNDGICDCCDGSDEAATTVGCKNICVEVATVWAKEEAEREERRLAGLRAKAGYVERAKVQLQLLRKEIEDWAKDRGEVEQQLETAKQLREKEEEGEKAEREEIRKKSEAEKAVWEKEQESANARRAEEAAERASLIAMAVERYGSFKAGGRFSVMREVKFASQKVASVGEGGVVEKLHEPAEAADSAVATVLLDSGLRFEARADEIAPAADQPPAQEPAAADKPAVENQPVPVCAGWRQTGGCSPTGPRESDKDKGCADVIPDGQSGYCECEGGRKEEFECSHAALTCQHTCEMKVPGVLITTPCPASYPFPIRTDASESDFVGRVCYDDPQHAEAGQGPCGTWCSRDAAWYETVKCKWGCDCGALCPGVSPMEATFSAAAIQERAEDTSNTFNVDDGSSHERAEAKAARDKVRELESRVTELRGKEEENRKVLDGNYGPDHEFLPLRDECFDYTTPDYTYKLCPFKDIKQGYTDLGRWKGWGQQTYGDWGGKDDLSVMKYEYGQSCWNGPQRSCEVKVVCGVENTLGNVQEPSMCTYTAVFHTPVACV